MVKGYSASQSFGSCCTGLVGRTREMNHLTLALEESFSGQSCLYSVTGEPGIGKTRLATEFASRARDLGAKVVWGRCSTFEVPPNWPWIQIMRGCENGGSATEIRDICQLLESGSSYAPLERFRLFDRIKSFLIAAARSRPLVIIIDDLHAADEPSLLLLGFFARELADANILMLLVFREAKLYFSPPTGGLFRDLALRTTKRISLGGLAPHEVGELIAQTTGEVPQNCLVDAFYEKTGGNPLFIEIALRHGLGDWRKPQLRSIPEVVRPAVEHYLSAVSSAAKDLLALASLIGGEFRFAVIRVASGREPEQLLDMLAESEFLGVLQRIDTPGGRYRFVHDFVRETLCDTITGADRARLHARIAEALEMLYERGVDVELADIAHHFVEGAAVSDAAKALEYCQRAAEQASQRQTSQEASRLYEMGFSILAHHLSCNEQLNYARPKQLVVRSVDSAGKALARHNRDHQTEAARAQITENDAPEQASLPDVRNGYSEIHATENRPPVIPSEKIFRREGEYWTIAYEGKVIRLRHSKGLEHIAHLMAHAGHEFHVTDLSTHEQSSMEPAMRAIEAEQNGLSQGISDAGPALDSSAKSSYRHRLQELREELREAKSFNDLGRIFKIESEIEFISRELAHAIGIGGRDRKICSETERARIRVTMAVKSTIKKISKQHPWLGRRLARSLRTGNFCSFEPEPPSSGAWQISFEPT
jgi:hypothetical protein